MSFKKTLIIALILLIAGAAYWWDQRRIGIGVVNEQQKSRLVLPDSAKVTELSIKRGGGETKLAKQGSDWRLTAPVNAPADQTIMSSVLSQLDQARKTGTFDVKPEELKNFGLDHPSAVVEVRASADNYIETFEIGHKTTDATAVYARIANSPSVFTVPVAVDSQVEQPPKYYRDKRLLPADASLATSVTLAYGNRKFALAKQNSKWMILDPSPGLADGTKVGDILHDVSFARAEDFIENPPKDLKPYGLDHAAWIGSFYLPVGDKNTSLTLMIGDVVTSGTAGANIRYAMNVGGTNLMQVPPDLPVKLQATLNDLKDKALFSIQPNEIGSAEIVAQGQTTRLVRDGTGPWRFKDSSDKVDQTKANIKTQGIAGLKAVKFIDDPTSEALAGLEHPILQLTLASADGKTTETLFTGRKASDGDYVYARKFGSEQIVAVDWKDPGNYILSHQDFVDKGLLGTSEEKVSKIEIQDGAKKLTLTPAATHWDVKAEGKTDAYTAEKADVSALLSALSSTEWERQLLPNTPADAVTIKMKNLDKPTRTIIVTDDTGNEVLHLAEPEATAPGLPGSTPTPTPALGAPAAMEKYVYVKLGADKYYAIDKMKFAPLKDALEKLISQGSIKKQ